MRSEQEMLALIIGIAEQDERIRAVYMNGSRTNPNAPRDFFQDYDIVYVVTETESFLRDEQWIHRYGELLMLQEPDKNDYGAGVSKPDNSRSYAYLMLFEDGNRIDLTLLNRNMAGGEYSADSLTLPLLDKDGILRNIPGPSDKDYRVSRPSEGQYISCCNNFWWCLQNTAKGIWRDEVPYAKQMFEQVTRHDLDTMLAWWIGTNHSYRVSVGKMGKYMKNYLPESYWNKYLETYADANPGSMWRAVFASSGLFRTAAQAVAAAEGFRYNTDDDTNMTRYLNRVKSLPPNAQQY